jgi:hypothetical protein
MVFSSSELSPKRSLWSFDKTSRAEGATRSKDPTDTRQPNIENAGGIRLCGHSDRLSFSLYCFSDMRLAVVKYPFNVDRRGSSSSGG